VVPNDTQNFIDPLYLLAVLKAGYGIAPSLVLATRHIIAIHPHVF
jgi:hypothetical protein